MLTRRTALETTFLHVEAEKPAWFAASLRQTLNLQVTTLRLLRSGECWALRCARLERLLRFNSESRRGLHLRCHSSNIRGRV